MIKKCLRLYSKQATRGGTEIWRSKKMAPVRESSSNDLHKTCKRRDVCLTELNDFAHLMLKEIHGETYQKIITTFKTLEHLIGSEQKPNFHLRDSFDVTEKDIDISRIKEISEILAELNEPSKKSLKHIRCKETDPFKVESLANDSNLIIDELEPYLNHYGEQTLETADSSEEKYTSLMERRILMEKAFEELSKEKSIKKRNDDGRYDEALEAIFFTKNALDDFDVITAKETAEDALSLLKELEKKQISM